jgi:putative ABC transport system permease protein
MLIGRKGRNTISMLKNYLKIAFRNLTKYKFISFINLFGLTVGLTCCLLILTYILHETSYDRYNSKADRIWRVTRSFNNPEGVVSLHLGAVAPPFGPLLKNDFPDIEQVTRILPDGTTAFHYGDKIFNEKDGYFAENNLFDVFDINLTEGDRHTALADPYSMIITREMAHKYFGDTDPINKLVQLDNRINFKVTGIFEPLPETSHFHPRYMLSFNTLKDSLIYGEKNLEHNWGNNAFFTYLLLPKDYPAKAIETRFPAFLDRHMGENYGPGTQPSKLTKLYLQRLTDIHLYSHLDEEMEQNGDINRVYIFGAIALFILLIACINYMNLSTARSTLRAKEIGIRKVSGAQRGELISQFLCESVLIGYLAFTLSASLTFLLLPSIDDLTGLHLSIAGLLQPAVLIPILLTPVLVGILSGAYPALFLSSFQPVKVLKGLFKAGSNTASFRKVLVVAQFSISIVLIISTAIVFEQLHYMQNASLGFNKDHIVVMNYNQQLGKNFNAFRNALLENSHILSATRSSRIPSGRLLDEQGASIESGDTLRPLKNADIKYVAVDHDFLKTYSIPIAAGRDYNRSFATDTNNFILNIAAANVLGMHDPKQLVGKSFSYGGSKGRVIGVMGDFNFESMHQQILPMIFIMPADSVAGNNFNNLSIKLSGTDIAGSLATIEKTWQRYLPEVPFEYTFLDEHFEQLYNTEQQQGSLFTIFSGIAIFIACLGLFGLSAFTITQRIKEIGVRKVLGASTGSIVQLLSTDFLKLVAIAACIAFPIAWYAMSHWLGDFAYRIPIH